MRHFGQSTSGNSAGLWMAAELEHAAAPPLNWLPLIWETAGGKGTGQKQAGVSRGQSTATHGNGVREKREKNGGTSVCLLPTPMSTTRSQSRRRQSSRGHLQSPHGRLQSSARVRRGRKGENTGGTEKNGENASFNPQCLIHLTRGNTGQYTNTTPASGPRYVPGVEKGKGEGQA